LQKAGIAIDICYVFLMSGSFAQRYVKRHGLDQPFLETVTPLTSAFVLETLELGTAE
jgi:hypothetical protein